MIRVERAFDFGDHLFNGASGSDVASNSNRSDAEFLCDTSRFRVCPVGLPRDDDNVNSFCCQTFRNGKADTYTAASDDGHFVF